MILDEVTNEPVTRRTRIAINAKSRGEDIVHALRATAAALPLALVAAPWPFQIVGLLYGAVWFVVILPATMFTLTVMFDAILLVTRHRPIFLMEAIAASRHPELLAQQKQRRVWKALEWYLTLSMAIAPLKNLATAMLVAAVRLRPRYAQVIWERAAREESQVLEALRRSPAARPTITLSRPIISDVDQIECALVGTA